MKNRRTKHSGWILLRRGALPNNKRFSRVRDYLKVTQAQLIEACGGPQEISIRDRLIVEQILRKLGFQILADTYLWQKGPFRVSRRGEVRPQPALSAFYLSTANSIRRDLESLNIKVSEQKIVTLQAYLAQRASGQQPKARVDRPQDKEDADL